MEAFLRKIDWPTVAAAAVVILIVLLVICVIAKLFRVAVGLAAVLILIPILFTIVWGDGSKYIDALGGFMTEEHHERLEDGYQYYKEQDAKDPIIDYDKVVEGFTNVFDGAKEQLTDYFSGTQTETKTDVFNENK